jgi:hypothetical protein
MEANNGGFSWGKRLEWHFCLTLFALLIFFSMAGLCSALSPPEWQYYNYLQNSVGKTPGVTVNEPIIDENDAWKIDVIVEDEGMRQAMATLLVRTWETGRIRVKDPQGNVQHALSITGTVDEKLAQLKTLFETAFGDNPYYREAETINAPLVTGVYPIFEAYLIQFHADDLSDWYWNQTYVARDLFMIVLKDGIAGIPIKPSTVMIP